MKSENLPCNIWGRTVWLLSCGAWNWRISLHIAAELLRHISNVYREVPEKDAKDYADSIHAIFVETSAKNAININEVFIEISECFLLPAHP